ncbi:neutral zinc metallopeptidase [Mycolicibacterium frederiksbergense]|jgi:predicted metalloprotease|uniref:neutral zinc metallopeptidase n=1 Tax=Mycolicibacterium frederiksbergense TaxID=117567 RepID=UPI00265C6891|nr:neutral zinc metallopeptidase [Mycolicibacterium frederiksbergense]MDO0977627.1 neutral zinc metallopeptidase [Mycolicibacterium frederiksbergense]
MNIKIMAAAAAMWMLAACGSPQPNIPSPTEKTGAAPDTSSITIEGDASEPVNQIAIQAIADLEQYWAQNYPELYGEDFEQIAGGYFAVTANSDAPPCTTEPDEVAGNAFYCSTEDVIAWDAQELLPDMQSKYGDFVIPVVMAHEFAHAVQARSNFTARTVTRELQADCFAGAWARHAQDTGAFEVSSADLDTALAGVLDLRDNPGTAKTDPNAHGSGFDRVSAFQDGFDNGLDRCKDYRDDEPMVLALPFNNVADAASGGDAPYDSIVNGVPYDLEDYWTQLYPELTNGRAWPPVAGLEAFDPANPPMCGNQSTEGYSLFYCVPDDYVGWDNSETMPEVYRQGGDYAVSTLLATQYGLAALTRLGDDSDEKTSTLRADCLAGGYTASVILQNRAETSSWSISPGDLDEGIKALLVFRGDGDADRQGAGFDRVRAFREGVINGAESCLDYEN